MNKTKRKIGIDASWACGDLTGTGRFTRDLIANLVELDHENTYVLYFRQCCRTGNSLFKLNQANVIIKVVDSPSKIFRILVPLSFNLRRDKIDIFLSPAYFLPLFGSKKWVVTFFDFNIYYLVREWARLRTLKGLLLMRILFPLSIRKADHIVTISVATQKDLYHFFPSAGSKSSVIYPGIDINRPCRSGQDISQFPPCFLYVGDLSPTKNLMRVIKAFSAFKKSDKKNIKLVLAGKDVAGYSTRELRPLIEALALEDKVEFLGYVSTERLIELYTSAVCLIFPSLREGFGYPIVDAMQAGLPVITSNVSSCPEIGGDAGLYVNPESTDEIAQAMSHIAVDEDLRSSLIEKGKMRAKQFDVKVTAEQYHKLLLGV